jgi:hypothetical protein
MTYRSVSLVNDDSDVDASSDEDCAAAASAPPAALFDFLLLLRALGPRLNPSPVLDEEQRQDATRLYFRVKHGSDLPLLSGLFVCFWQMHTFLALCTLVPEERYADHLGSMRAFWSTMRYVVHRQEHPTDTSLPLLHVPVAKLVSGLFTHLLEVSTLFGVTRISLADGYHLSQPRVVEYTGDYARAQRLVLVEACASNTNINKTNVSNMDVSSSSSSHAVSNDSLSSKRNPRVVYEFAFATRP